MARIFALALIAFILPITAHAQVIEGSATVIDGDTIDMTGTRIRLAYIDAPEAAQTCLKNSEIWACGADATESLTSIVGAQAISCSVIATDVYGRSVATCQTRVFDIGREMVRRGMAVASENAPHSYQEAAEIAQRIDAGLWSSTFQTPSEWRAENPHAAPREERPDPESRRLEQPQQEMVYRNQWGCAIKGNRSRRGDWIYHLPGRPYYDQTRAEEMFCTESEARAAGYRRSKA